MLGACNSHVTSVSTKTSEQENATTAGMSSVKFECVKSNGSACHSVVFTSTCTNGPGANGMPSQSCTYQVLAEVSLREGESKEVSGLPAGFKHCTAIGEKPKFPTCAP